MSNTSLQYHNPRNFNCIFPFSDEFYNKDIDHFCKNHREDKPDFAALVNEDGEIVHMEYESSDQGAKGGNNEGNICKS